MREFFIFVVNPGATSTKVGFFQNEGPLWQENISHGEEELKRNGVMAQKDYRARALREVVAKKGFNGHRLSCSVGRGGLLKPLKSGTYRIDERMLEDLRIAARGEHASNLGAVLAFEIAREYRVPSFIVDPVSVDEMEDVARITGMVEIERESLSHALNTKAVAKRHATTIGKRYADLRLIVAHLGTGISISAHLAGKMIDVVNPKEEGPFSPDRAGGVPSYALARLCYSGKHDLKSLEKKLFGDGGMCAHLGTRDLRKVMEMIAAGDRKARLVFDAMVYQTAKHIAAMAAVLDGDVDFIILTGGMAKEENVVKGVEKRVSFIAPVVPYPGEDELKALAEGALRVLREEEEVMEYPR